MSFLYTREIKMDFFEKLCLASFAWSGCISLGGLFLWMEDPIKGGKLTAIGIGLAAFGTLVFLFS